VRFKRDEDADRPRDEGLIEAPADVVLDLVRPKRRVLLTLDTGIADVRAHPSEAHIPLPPTTHRVH
jgi:hypothetical protein